MPYSQFCRFVIAFNISNELHPLARIVIMAVHVALISLTAQLEDGFIIDGVINLIIS